MANDREMNTFTLRELAGGAELVLSGDLEDVKTSGKQLPWGQCMGYEPEEPLTALVSEGRVMGHEDQSRVTYEPSLTWLPALGLVLRSSCNCAQFTRDTYCCPHVAALHFRRMLGERGEDAFRGTALEEELRLRAGVDDPFQPGALRRTDDRLLSLLDREDDLHLPEWRPARRITALMEVDIDLDHGSRGALALQLKLGSTRHYQIQDMRALVEAYLHKRSFPFGRTEQPVSPDTCSDRANAVLGMLA